MAKIVGINGVDDILDGTNKKDTVYGDTKKDIDGTVGGSASDALPFLLLLLPLAIFRMTRRKRSTA